jgi:hypothetical protein
MSDAAPDLIEPLIGFRSWWLKGERLKCLGSDVCWNGPVMHAACLRGGDPASTGSAPIHEAPEPECSCGIHVLHSPGGVIGREPAKVWGIVSLWGRIIVYRTGMRAQHARIMALAPTDPGQSLPVARVARRLGVDTLPFGELAEASARYGAPIPGHMLPPGPRLEYRDLDPSPAFRFVYRSTGALRIYPWGCGAEGLEEEVDLTGATGDVFALDPGRAVAVFGHAGAARLPASRALLGWADKDRWRLDISSEDAPLARSTNRNWGEAWCSCCARPAIDKDDWKERMKMSGRGFMSTSHWVCGGRLVWRR